MNNGRNKSEKISSSTDRFADDVWIGSLSNRLEIKPIVFEYDGCFPIGDGPVLLWIAGRFEAGLLPAAFTFRNVGATCDRGSSE
jgi:hypothetical protein